MPRTLKLVLAYDGTRFVGWQRQAEGISIQGLVEEALGRIEGRPVAVAGSGRTDAGVHALGQVASARLEHALPPADLLRALNAMLPAEVRVLSVDEAPDGFHARHSARAKTYRYLLAPAPAGPFASRFAWVVPFDLDASAMQEAAGLLAGEHDFAAFQSTGTPVAHTRRHIFRSEVRVSPLDAVIGMGLAPPALPGARVLAFEVTADGFLRHMVRAIAGSLAEIGAGRHDPSWLGEVLRSGVRREAGPTAPACGLFLVGVGY
jgi:tRNA pseudouridine38-40 synthase